MSTVTEQWGRRDLLAAGLPQLRDPFRGDVTDYLRTIKLGNGYDLSKVKNVCRNCRSQGISSCRHFEIDTCRQLIGPFRAQTDPNVQLVMNLKAAQTLGSLNWDMLIHFLLVHTEYQSIIAFLENDPKALTYCDKRLMPTLKRNPDLIPLLPVGVERHDNTKTDIIFKNGKTVRICGLNDSNASSLTWQVVIISEGWQHGMDGLIQKAMDRAKQVESKKIIIESQAGLKDEDQDEIWKRVRQVPVTWVCPFCGGKQTFGLDGPAIIRPENFKPLTPAIIQPKSDEWEQIFRGVEIPDQDFTPPKPFTYAGLKTPRKSVEISSNEELIEAADKAYLECFHCGIRMADSRLLRQKLMQSYEQEYRDKTDSGYVTPQGLEVGFWMPEPVSVTVSFRETMKEFLIAQKASESGNYLPFQIFYQSRWAKAWSEKEEGRVRITPSFSSLDPHIAIQNELFRGMSVDPQKDPILSAQHPEIKVGVTGNFWVVAHAVDKQGNEKQLWRGYCLSWDEWISKAKELHVPAANIVVDGRYSRGEVITQAAAHAELMDEMDSHGRKTGRKFFATWTVLLGATYRSWKHADGYYRDFSQSKPELVPVYFNGKNMMAQVNVVEWSNFRFKMHVLDMLENSAKSQPNSNIPTLTALPSSASDPKASNKFLLSEKTRSMEVDGQQHQRSWESQMSSNKLGENRQGKPEVIEIHKDPHYFDCLCGMVYLKKRFGLLGAVAAPEMSAPEAS